MEQPRRSSGGEAAAAGAPTAAAAAVPDRGASGGSYAGSSCLSPSKRQRVKQLGKLQGPLPWEVPEPVSSRTRARCSRSGVSTSPGPGRGVGGWPPLRTLPGGREIRPALADIPSFALHSYCSLVFAACCCSR